MLGAKALWLTAAVLAEFGRGNCCCARFPPPTPPTPFCRFWGPDGGNLNGASGGGGSGGSCASEVDAVNKRRIAATTMRAKHGNDITFLSLIVFGSCTLVRIDRIYVENGNEFNVSYNSSEFMPRNRTDSFSIVEIIAKSKHRDRKVCDSEFSGNIRSDGVYSVLTLYQMQLACNFGLRGHRASTASDSATPFLHTCRALIQINRSVRRVDRFACFANRTRLRMFLNGPYF